MLRRASTNHLKRPYEEGRLQEEVSKLKRSDLFTDNEFPAAVASLIERRDVPPYVLDVPKFTQQTAWKRANDIWKDTGTTKECELFTIDNLKPSAVKQGGLENCYFLASLSSLCLHPDRVIRLFLNNTSPDNGIYAVRFFCNGRPNEVVVDDWLPIKKDSKDASPLSNKIPKHAKVTIQSKTDNGDGTVTTVTQIEFPDGRMQMKKTTTDIETPTGTLKFSKTSTEELWVSIIEKAYAKVHGTYAALEAGCHYETIRDLTGAPGFFYKTVDVDHHGQLMEEFYHNRFPMSCGIDYTYSMPWSDSDLEQVGLLPMHAYSILAVATITDAKGHHQRLVKLRNPWGDAKEWNGAWSNTSSLWTPNIRHQIQQQGIPLEDPKAVDGIFWMAWQDFSKYFNSWDVNKYQDHGRFSATILQDNPSVGYHLVTVQVKHSGDYTFGISQCSNRMMPPSTRYQYSSVRAILVKALEPSQNDVSTTEDQVTAQQKVQSTSLAGCHFLKGVVGEKRDEYIELEHGLNPGMYFLFVQVWWDPSSKHLPTRSISVNCYGSARVKFGQDLAPAYDRVEVLTELFRAKVIRELGTGRQHEVVCRSRGRPHAQAIHEYYNRNTCSEGYHFRLFSNSEIASVSNIALHEDKKFTSLQGGELVKPARHASDFTVTGKNAYSIRVRPGQTKGVFLMVKSTFGMAGPTGKATIILSCGRSEPEKESQQTEIAALEGHNLPTETGVQQSAAPVEQLITLYVGGSKDAEGRSSRRSSVISVFASMRGSTTTSTRTDFDGRRSLYASLRSSIARATPAGASSKLKTEASTSKRHRNSSIFSGWAAKKSQDKIEPVTTLAPFPTDEQTSNLVAASEPSPLSPISSGPMPNPSEPLPMQNPTEAANAAVSSTTEKPSNLVYAQPSSSGVTQPSNVIVTESAKDRSPYHSSVGTVQPSNIAAESSEDRGKLLHDVNEPFLGTVGRLNKVTLDDNVVLIVDETSEADSSTLLSNERLPETMPAGQANATTADPSKTATISPTESDNFLGTVRRFNKETPEDNVALIIEETSEALIEKDDENQNHAEKSRLAGLGGIVSTTKTDLNGPDRLTSNRTTETDDPSPTATSSTSPTRPEEGHGEATSTTKPSNKQVSQNQRKGTQRFAPSFLARLFGGSGYRRRKRMGRPPTFDEEQILAPFPDLKGGTILESTKTTITTTTIVDGATERGVSTVRTTSLRVLL